MRMQVPDFRGLRAITPFPFPGVSLTSKRSFMVFCLDIWPSLIALQVSGHTLL